MVIPVFGENVASPCRWRYVLETGPGLSDLMRATFLPNDDGSPHLVVFRVSDPFQCPKAMNEAPDRAMEAPNKMRSVVVEIVGVDRRVETWEYAPGSFAFRGQCVLISPDCDGRHRWAVGRSGVIGEINVDSRVGHIELPWEPYEKLEERRSA